MVSERKGRMPKLHERTGPFWDAVAGRIPVPPAAASLGLEVIEADPEPGTIELAFEATHGFTTPRGDVLEGFLAAMLHETVGPAVLATLEPDQFIVTLDLKSTFLQPVYPGRVIGMGRVVHRDADIAFAEGELFDSEGRLVATGASTIRIVAFPGASKR
jgi:uncharacterized protein (TIGR00369 family)